MLPPELRNAIYELALLQQEPVIVTYGRFGECKWQAPALLQTCQMLRNEASCVYYGCNTFNIRLWDMRSNEHGQLMLDKTLAKWLGSLPEGDRGLVCSIRIDDHVYEEEDEQFGSRARSCRLVLEKLGLKSKEVEIFLELGDGEGDPKIPERWVRV